MTFRAGVVPRLSLLDRPLRDRGVELEVRRMSPLSLVLKQIDAGSVTDTLLRALRVLRDARVKAA